MKNKQAMLDLLNQDDDEISNWLKNMTPNRFRDTVYHVLEDQDNDTKNACLKAFHENEEEPCFYIGTTLNGIKDVIDMQKKHKDRQEDMF